MADLLIGAAFTELQNAVSEVIVTIAIFKSLLKSLQATILKICPIFEDIVMLNEVLDRPFNQIQMFSDQMKQATDLILMCSKIKSWNLYKKYVYAKKLQDFDESLKIFFNTEVQAYQVRSMLQVSKDVIDVSKDVGQVVRDVRIVNDKLDVLKELMGSTSKALKSSSSTSSRNSGFSGVCELPKFIIGLDLPLEELKAMLLKDNLLVPAKNNSSQQVPVPMVVQLSAPPGCGKTVLANMVCLDSVINDKFKDNIFFVTVSKTVNIKVIVQKIFRQKGCLDQLLEVQEDEDSIIQLGQLLKGIGGGPEQDPILLVLDDVWSPGLESLVDKFKFTGIHGYKILVTSRFDPPKSQPDVYRLSLLNHQDAKDLFCYYAFPPGSCHPRPSDGLVNEIVKSCKGFPLALRVVGLSLGDKHEVVWKTTLDKWSKGESNILDTNSELLQKLKTSLDALDEEEDMEVVKECFQDLGSFPEDQKIPATALMDMWVELYELDEEDMYTYKNLLELSTRNLLNLVPMRKDDSSVLVGYCNGEFVTQHDMLRELAIHQSRQEPIELRKRLIMEIGRNGLPKKLLEKFKEPLNARLLSISTDDSFTSSWFDVQLPEAEILILNFRNRDFTLPKFIEHMEKLKVLIVTNYGFSPAGVNNLPMVGCFTNLKRMRLEHVAISSSLGSIFALPVMNLRKISLIMCEIGNALDNCVNFFPNLEEIEIEYCHDLVKVPVGVCHIVNLKKISITSCNELSALPEDIERLVNLQSLRLNSCTRLQELPTTIGSLQKLSLLDISDCLSLAEMPKRIGELQGLRTLNMRGCRGLFELPVSVKELRDLMVFCDKQTASLWEFYDNVHVIPVKEDINLNWLNN